ncbi:hypothetical protein [Polyangium mundeleinium]|uniref:Uncharacterized protein n=1 Tax=Polyangium mundeleinium TaxID=2995306 RepID=A0ABT5EGH1_9BACT|nr:hypothetical protein [Polyangium mundeleinium]MDC0740856.1 hypothetical protein [Polyangium mundeleinium]
MTVDPGTSYDREIDWLDAGIRYARECADRPVYATVAIADGCLRYTDPERNSLLDLIADSVSARGVDGVYIVVEQGGEATESRQCSNFRTLASLLHLIHLLARDSGLSVAVNFVGSFGLVCIAAGANLWASGWYKSQYRMRLADAIAGGRAFPSYWSHLAASDLSLDEDFDNLVAARLLGCFQDHTNASAGLLQAARSGNRVSDVPPWRYAQSNVTTCSEHFFLSSIAATTRLSNLPESQRLPSVEQWLTQAVSNTQQVARRLGSSPKTKIGHVRGWLDALLHYRRTHNV